ncbi:unnamed protein product [Bemisia tabaci]|uniref:Uncharacterized protein n=1 Tax=Bemisia tabaci TaxID=7038 RepID=A0A9P0AN70_BEMTA|nr:unnamed protein product [Bemisia tabaci]
MTRWAGGGGGAPIKTSDMKGPGIGGGAREYLVTPMPDLQSSGRKNHTLNWKKVPFESQRSDPPSDDSKVREGVITLTAWCKTPEPPAVPPPAPSSGGWQNDELRCESQSPSEAAISQLAPLATGPNKEARSEQKPRMSLCYATGVTLSGRSARGRKGEITTLLARNQIRVHHPFQARKIGDLATPYGPHVVFPRSCPQDCSREEGLPAQLKQISRARPKKLATIVGTKTFTRDVSDCALFVLDNKAESMLCYVGFGETSDVGTFCCLVNTTVGALLSRPATVRVTDKDPVHQVDHHFVRRVKAQNTGIPANVCQCLKSLTRYRGGL